VYDYFIDRFGRKVSCIPRLFHVAPAAAHVASADAHKERSTAGVEPFALERVKLFHDRKHLPFAEKAMDSLFQ
jgi:hypothetical protein